MNQKLLFICSRNKWRSRTADEIFRGVPGYDVKSAGTEPGARIRVAEGLLGWADVIFVMERKHADYLREKFPEAIAAKPVHNLRIPDDFEFMDRDLVTILRQSVAEHLEPPGEPTECFTEKLPPPLPDPPRHNPAGAGLASCKKTIQGIAEKRAG